MTAYERALNFLQVQLMNEYPPASVVKALALEFIAVQSETHEQALDTVRRALGKGEGK